MAEQETQAPEAEGKRKGGMGRLLVMLAFIGLVVLAECAVALMVFPSAEQISELAKQKEEAEATSGDSEDLPDDMASLAGDLVELDLGQFSVSSYQPLSNTTLRIDLHLYGLVLADEEISATEQLEKNTNRIREQVLVILRSAELADLTDAGLGLIKRKILEKTNRTLGKALLQEIVFSEFSFLEQ